jgi:hypothetical protein
MMLDLYHQYARSAPIIMAILCFFTLRFRQYVLLVIISAVLVIWQIPLLLRLFSWLTGEGTPSMDLPLFVQILCLVFGFYCLIKSMRALDRRAY